MDGKKLGKIPVSGGWRVHGWGDGNHDRNVETGCDYVHSLVDDHFGLAYSEVLPDEKGTTCAEFLIRGIDYFAAHGMTRIDRLMADNACAYKWSLREVCAEDDIVQKFIKPHCPWWNGRGEQLDRTLATEWAYREVLPPTMTGPQPCAMARALQH